MRYMFSHFYSIDHKDRESAQLFKLTIRNIVGISYISQTSETKAQNRHFVMHCPDRYDFHPVNKKRMLINSLKQKLRDSRIFVVCKGIRIFQLQGILNSLLAIYRKCSLFNEVKCSHVIQTSCMIFVVVGQKYSVEMTNILSQHLLP